MSKVEVEVAAACTERIADETEEVAEAAGNGAGLDLPLERREEHILAACDCVIELAAALFGIPSKELRRRGRGPDEISRVRQIAMYVAHVVLWLNMTDLGKGFGRDRTTVMHACHLIEDMRDEEEFDRIVSQTERIVQAAFRSRTFI